MNPPRQIKTRLVGKTVFLRRPRPSDCAEFIALNRASTAFHRGLASPPKTPKQFADDLKRNRAGATDLFFICRQEDGAVTGAINLGQIVRGALQSAYRGYFMGASFARRGYMTEALQLSLRHAFVLLKLHRVEANIQPGNRASRTLVRRAGFRREGFSSRDLKIADRWRDHERWALTIEDWKRRARP